MLLFEKDGKLNLNFNKEENRTANDVVIQQVASKLIQPSIKLTQVVLDDTTVLGDIEPTIEYGADNQGEFTITIDDFNKLKTKAGADLYSGITFTSNGSKDWMISSDHVEISTYGLSQIGEDMYGDTFTVTIK